ASGLHSKLLLASLPEQGQTFGIARGKMRIEAGGLVKSRTGAISTGTATTANEVVIRDAASQWEIAESLIIGGALIEVNGQNGHAILWLADGTVQANYVLVGAGGIIQGDGIIYVPDPASSVENTSGTLIPGSVQLLTPLEPIAPANVPVDTGASSTLRTRGLHSPAPPAPATNMLTILGSYKQSANGRLLVTVGGTNVTDYGRLTVTNAATLDGNVTFKFINGFAPKKGDHFDFLSVG